MDTAMGYLEARYGTPKIERDFVEAYREVFAEPPHQEHHTKSQVRDEVWKPHLDRGLIVLAYDESELAGFVCAMPLIDPWTAGVSEFLSALGFAGDPVTTWYTSELAVREPYRRQGIGATLVLKHLLLIRARGAESYCLATVSKDSQSEPLYRKIGAVELGVNEEIGYRYFTGSCEEAIAALRKT